MSIMRHERGAYRIDVQLLGAGARNFEVTSITSRVYSPSAANDVDEAVSLLESGIAPATGATVVSIATANGLAPFYVYESDARLDASVLADELAFRLAEDARRTELSTLLIVREHESVYTLRLSSIEGFRVRVWEFDSNQSSRLI